MQCVHEQLFEKQPSFFEYDLPKPWAVPRVAVIARKQASNFYVFSVQQSLGQHDSSKRVFVELDRSCIWSCLSCRESACRHIALVEEDARAAGLLDSNGLPCNLDDPRNEWPVPSLDEVELARAAQDSELDSTRKRQAVSTNRRPPPAFIRSLPRDRPCAPSTFPPPAVITRTEIWSGRCASCRVWTSSRTADIGSVDAKVLTLTRAFSTKVPVMRCHICRKISCGPDLDDLSFFNWNNTFIFAREVFDDLLSAMTRSETLIVSYYGQLQDRYEASSSAEDLCSRSTFTRAWYAYLELLDIDSGMSCPKCGSEPTCVIADGTAIGYPKKYRTGNLRPATWLDESPDPVHNARVGLIGPCLTAESFGSGTNWKIVRKTLWDNARSRFRDGMTDELRQKTKVLLRSETEQGQALGRIFQELARNPNAEKTCLSALLRIVRLSRLFDSRLALIAQQICSADSVLQVFPPSVLHPLAVWLSANPVDFNNFNFAIKPAVPFLTDFVHAVQDGRETYSSSFMTDLVLVLRAIAFHATQVQLKLVEKGKPVQTDPTYVP